MGKESIVGELSEEVVVGVLKQMVHFTWATTHSAIIRDMKLRFEDKDVKDEIKEIKKEVPLGKSRIDFTMDGVPLEVKGCSLVKDKIALFPDAPTESQEWQSRSGMYINWLDHLTCQFIGNASNIITIIDTSYRHKYQSNF